MEAIFNRAIEIKFEDHEGVLTNVPKDINTLRLLFKIYFGNYIKKETINMYYVDKENEKINCNRNEEYQCLLDSINDFNGFLSFFGENCPEDDSSSSCSSSQEEE